MIAKPSIGELLDKIDCRYTLVTVVSRRARQIANGSMPLTKFEAESKVSVAAHEVAEGKLYIEEETEGEE